MMNFPYEVLFWWNSTLESDRGGILPQHSTCPDNTYAKYCHSLLLLPSQLLVLLLPICHHWCCCCYHCFCLHCCWCWCSWNTQGCDITVHQWRVCHIVSFRGEDGHTTGTKVASEYRQVQLVCADLFRLTAPFLLAVNACHNGQKGEQQTLWLTGHLFILWCLLLCNCLKSNI